MAFPYPYPGPVPAYNNLPIEPQFYQPRVFYISNINLGQTTIVTATTDLDYVIGQLCRLIIPPTFGCRQLNEMTGYVISIPDTDQVELNINSSVNVDPFIASNAPTQPTINAVGDINYGYISSTGRSVPSTNIPGSFINISP